MNFSYASLLAFALLAVAPLGTLGEALAIDLRGTALSDPGQTLRDASAPQVTATALGALGNIGKVARALTEVDVRAIRKAASEAFASGQSSTQVALRNGSMVEVSAIPDYKSYSRQIAHTPEAYAQQTERLKDLLNQAWDESIARGYFQAPQERTMYEFTGMDMTQRSASQKVYAPEGVFSVYMHGSPNSLSRHAIILEHDPANPRRAHQVFRQQIKLRSGESKVEDLGSSPISVKDVVSRIEQEGMPEGVPLLFRACSAGGCPIEGFSIAQQVADRSNRPVIAASDIHYRPVTTLNGEQIVQTYVDGDTGPGEWRLFLPQSWHDNLPQGGALRLAEDLRGTHELALLPDEAFSSIDLGSNLADFSGRQNRGAILDAARKLETGGTLTLRWSAQRLEVLQKAAQESFRDRFLNASSAERVVAYVTELLDPRTTLGKLDQARYEVSILERGDSHAAIVRRR